MDAARRARGAATVAAGLAVAGLTACGGGADLPGYGGGAPTTQDEPNPTVTDGDRQPDDGTGSDDARGDNPSGDVPFEADDRPDTGRASQDAALVVTDVRVGTHDGFDRVVLDLGGTGTPGWRVAYVDRATDDGSGRSVEVDGDEVLQIRLSGMALPTDVPEVAEYDGGRIDPDGTASVEDVVHRFWFEGYTTTFVGIESTDDGGRPDFRVFTLEDPARVVVDVAHSSAG